MEPCVNERDEAMGVEPSKPEDGVTCTAVARAACDVGEACDVLAEIVRELGPIEICPELSICCVMVTVVDAIVVDVVVASASQTPVPGSPLFV